MTDLARRKFLTVQEAANLMRVSSMTVTRLIRRGELTAYRIGRSLRIDQDDLDAYLQRGYSGHQDE